MPNALSEEQLEELLQKHDEAQLENADNDYESQSSRSWLTEQFVFTDALLALLGGTTNGK